MLTVLASLALSVTEQLLATRRSVAATAALGTEPRRLRTVQVRALRSGTVPPVVVGTAATGVLFGLLAGSSWAARATAAGLGLAAAVVAGLLVAAGCRLLAGMRAGQVRRAAALENLRIP